MTKASNAWEKMNTYIDMYADKVVVNNCFQKLLYQEMAKTRKNELIDKIISILMDNVMELRKILQEGMDKGQFNKYVDMDMVIATLYGTKNYIINTPQITSVMLGYDVQDDSVIEEKLKPRIKNYIKSLLKAYLLVDNHAEVKN